MVKNWNRTPYGEFDYTKTDPVCLYGKDNKQGERLAVLETNHTNLQAMITKLEKDLSDDLKSEAKRLAELMEMHHIETKTLVKSIQKTAQETQSELEKVKEEFSKFKHSINVILAKLGVVGVIAMAALSYFGSHAADFVINRLRG